MTLLSRLFGRAQPYAALPPALADTPPTHDLERLQHAQSRQDATVRAITAQDRENAIGAGIVRFREAGARNAEAVRRGERMRNSRGWLVTMEEQRRREAALDELGELDGALLGQGPWTECG